MNTIQNLWLKIKSSHLKLDQLTENEHNISNSSINECIQSTKKLDFKESKYLARSFSGMLSIYNEPVMERKLERKNSLNSSIILLHGQPHIRRNSTNKN
uniref:Uncharacterized protein n=1 Tax=Acrobeloides nanus TaxID=290746 RepID=A0A914EBX7_9BILA